MSDGPCLTGAFKEADLTFKDIERNKWERAREDCPCRFGGYCNCNFEARCAMEVGPYKHFQRFQL